MKWIGLLGWLVLVFAAAAVGSRFMPGEWYASLRKPPLTPPGWVFGPVWTILYVLMAVAAWLVWKRYGFAGAGLALALFIAQVVLNALWSALFFGMQRPGLALIDLAALWVLIAIVTFMFWQKSPAAGAMMIPYLLWVTFAGYLNFGFWRLN
jgi:translocator protein